MTAVTLGQPCPFVKQHDTGCRAGRLVKDASVAMMDPNKRKVGCGFVWVMEVGGGWEGGLRQLSNTRAEGE